MFLYTIHIRAFQKCNYICSNLFCSKVTAILSFREFEFCKAAATSLVPSSYVEKKEEKGERLHWEEGSHVAVVGVLLADLNSC